MGAVKKKEQEPVEIVAGLFSRKEAAQHISKGVPHVHSSTLGQQDSLVEKTQEILSTKANAPYSWETQQKSKKIWVSSSAFRSEVIQSIVQDIALHHKRELKEKTGLLLEELLTNALYHSYKKEDGTDKYFRKDKIELNATEKVSVEYFSTKEGVFVSVTDYGGSFSFKHLVNAFHRCYSAQTGPVIETKDGGAGLGLYMVFEMITHLRIDHEPGKSTRVSCWISAPKFFDPDYFSFNFFEWRHNGSK